MGLDAKRILLAGALLVPAAAMGGAVYSYVDPDGVVHFTNAPSDRRYRKVTRTSDVAGVYRPPPKPSSGAAASKGQIGYDPHIKTAAEKYKIPVELLRAVMAVESNYNERAISEKGAVGLMQLMPRTAQDMYVGDIWDPAQNIDGGARYLRFLANQYEGDVVKTLAAYNAGPDAVKRAGGAVPNIPETQEYVRRVLALYQDYRAGR
ncbi:MAG TPA: lytic transglycosylase domain-containing protein [Anaeromyxobacteraceae bacterium]|nr:lytic transglycosylase domain-containing protein [Anaeromyxobacteraceae bacterium]